MNFGRPSADTRSVMYWLYLPFVKPQTRQRGLDVTTGARQTTANKATGNAHFTTRTNDCENVRSEKCKWKMHDLTAEKPREGQTKTLESGNLH